MSKRFLPILGLLAAAPAFSISALAAPAPAQTIATQGMVYVIPDGWVLDRFRPDKAVVLRHEATGAKMLISRPAKARTGPPPKHVERTGNGRVVQWDYAAEAMDGRVVVSNVELWLTIMTPDLSPVPPGLGVPAMRRVADTAQLTGPLVATPATPPPPAK
jgi:hypothetical protein